MGKLIVTFMGETKEYLINTETLPHVQDAAVGMILKHYPQDAHVDFIELW